MPMKKLKEGLMLYGLNDALHLFSDQQEKLVSTYYEEGVATDACDSMAETMPETCDSIVITEELAKRMDELLRRIDDDCKFYGYDGCYGALVVSTVKDNRIHPYGSYEFLEIVNGVIHEMGFKFQDEE